MTKTEPLATLFLRETYPHYISKNYEIFWMSNTVVEIMWRYGKTGRTRHYVEDIVSTFSQEVDISYQIDSFVSKIYPLEAAEVSHQGHLAFSSKTHTWEVVSNRPGGIRKHAFFNSFSVEDKERMKKGWDKRWNENNFKIVSQNLLVEIISLDPSVPPCHALYSTSNLDALLQDSYDVSNKTQILIGSKLSDSLLIGHENAVERLFDIPGNSYCRKDYMKINDELWSGKNGK